MYDIRLYDKFSRVSTISCSQLATRPHLTTAWGLAYIILAQLISDSGVESGNVGEMEVDQDRPSLWWD